MEEKDKEEVVESRYVEVNPDVIDALITYYTGRDAEEILREIGVKEEDIELLLEEGKTTGRLLNYIHTRLNIPLTLLVTREMETIRRYVLDSTVITVPIRLRITVDRKTGKVNNVEAELLDDAMMNK